MFTTHYYDFEIRQDQALREAEHYRLIKSLNRGESTAKRINRLIRTVFTALLIH